MRAIDKPPIPWQHLCIHGDPKVGKSTLVSLLASQGYNIYWFSTDGGFDVIYKLPLEAVERIEVFHLKDTREHPIAVNTLRRILDGKEYNLCDFHGRIDCKDCKSTRKGFSKFKAPINDPMAVVVLDHISGAAESGMNLAFLALPDKASAKPLLDLELGEVNKQEWEHHRMQGQLMDGILKQVEHAEFHVICLAHTIEVTMEDKSKKMVPQIGSVNFSATGGKYFSSIIYMELKNGKHRAGSGTTYKAGYLSGSRTDVRIEDLPEPSLLPFFTTKIGDGKESGVSKGSSTTSNSDTKVDGGGETTAGTVLITMPEGLSVAQQQLWKIRNKVK